MSTYMYAYIYPHFVLKTTKHLRTRNRPPFHFSKILLGTSEETNPADQLINQPTETTIPKKEQHSSKRVSTLSDLSVEQLATWFWSIGEHAMASTFCFSCAMKFAFDLRRAHTRTTNQRKQTTTTEVNGVASTNQACSGSRTRDRGNAIRHTVC